MTTAVKLTTAWAALDASAADLLITGDPFLLFMAGNAAPVAASDSHAITPPMVIPQGTGAYIKATSAYGGNVIISHVLASTTPPVAVVKP